MYYYRSAQQLLTPQRVLTPQQAGDHSAESVKIDIPVVHPLSGDGICIDRRVSPPEGPEWQAAENRRLRHVQPWRRLREIRVEAARSIDAVAYERPALAAKAH